MMLVEWLDLVVLTVMTAVFGAGRESIPAAMPLAGAFVVLSGLTAALALGEHHSARVEWIRAGLPGIVLLAVYGSMSRVIAAAGSPPRDVWIIAIERSLTGGGLPPLTPLALPPLVLDALSLAYLAYFALPVLLVGGLLRRGRLADAHAALLTLLVAFYTHYLIYALMPVAGPARTPELTPALQWQLTAGGGWLTHAVRSSVGMLEGATADAFPSAHTSVAVLTAALAWRFRVPCRRAFVALAAAIVASTVLLGYHYIVDVVAALPIAAVAWRLSAALDRRFAAHLESAHADVSPHRPARDVG
jgi:membrane-associated phospholipid phosphatase